MKPKLNTLEQFINHRYETDDINKPVRLFDTTGEDNVQLAVYVQAEANGFSYGIELKKEDQYLIKVLNGRNRNLNSNTDQEIKYRLTALLRNTKKRILKKHVYNILRTNFR